MISGCSSRYFLFFLSILSNAHSAFLRGANCRSVRQVAAYLASSLPDPRTLRISLAAQDAASETDRPCDLDRFQYSWCTCWTNTSDLSRNIVDPLIWFGKKFCVNELPVSFINVQYVNRVDIYRYSVRYTITKPRDRRSRYTMSTIWLQENILFRLLFQALDKTTLVIRSRGSSVLFIEHCKIKLYRPPNDR